MLIMQISSPPLTLVGSSGGYERLLSPLLTSFASQMRVKFLRLMLTAFVSLWVAYDLWHSDRTYIKCASNSAIVFYYFFCVCNECAECVNCESSDFVSSIFTFSVPFSVIHECNCVSLILQCLYVWLCAYTAFAITIRKEFILCLFFIYLRFPNFLITDGHHVYSWIAQVFYYWNVHLKRVFYLFLSHHRVKNITTCRVKFFLPVKTFFAAICHLWKL